MWSRTDILPKSLVLVAVGTYIAYHVSKVIYNLFFHPLRHIPGPKLAAATYIPEFYYDVLRSGSYTRQIMQMHAKYGILAPLPGNKSRT